MKEMTYKTGEVSKMPNSFDIFPRKTVAEVAVELKKEPEKIEKLTQVKKAAPAKKKEIVVEQPITLEEVAAAAVESEQLKKEENPAE